MKTGRWLTAAIAAFPLLLAGPLLLILTASAGASCPSAGSPAGPTPDNAMASPGTLPASASPGTATTSPPAQSGLAHCAGSSDQVVVQGEIPPGHLPDGYEIPRDAPEPVRTAIRWALLQLGTPYQWGGTCENAHGPDPMARCDCSSLTQRSYLAAGIKITRTTYTQVHEGTYVGVSELRPGDLVFTRGSAAVPEHVGMVIGTDLIIHAPRTGSVVSVATLSSWRPDILAARRIVG